MYNFVGKAMKKLYGKPDKVECALAGLIRSSLRSASIALAQRLQVFVVFDDPD